MRFRMLLAAAMGAATLAGCSDEPVSVAGGDARLVFSSNVLFSGPAAGLPITAVRLTPLLHPEGEPLGEPFRKPVEPDDATFHIAARIDLGGRDSALIDVRIEMLSVASGSEIVEWSALVGPIMVHANRSNVVDETVALIRGPIENQFVSFVSVLGPDSMFAGQTQAAYAFVETSGTSHTVLWISTDETVLTVDPVGDSVDVHATGGGEAMIIAAAGAHADTLVIVVRTTTAGPIAQVIAFPDSAVVIVGSSRTWQAMALDSLEIPVSATFAWATLDAAVATVSGTGVVTAQALGRAGIVVSAGGFADTAIVIVENLPAGVNLIWQGGTPGFEDDWFTADNWSPARVPTATDVIYIPFGSGALTLNANAEVGGIVTDTTFGFFFQIGANTLTVHGDVLARFGIFGDTAGRIVIDAASADIAGFLPSLRILGAVTAIEPVFVSGDVEIDGTSRPASLDVGTSQHVSMTGDLRVTNATLVIADDSLAGDYGSILVQGDVNIDGGDSRASMTGGFIIAYGDFSVSATSCNAFAPTGTAVDIIADAARISIGCAGASGNHFHDLYFIPFGAMVGPVLTLDSDIIVTDELYLNGFFGTRVIGNGHTIRAANGAIYTMELERAFLEIASTSADQSFYLDSVTISGMSGQTRPQIVYSHPGDPCACYTEQSVRFDSSSSGPYIHAIDTDSLDGFPLTLYMARNPGDGPARTVTTGGAQVHWAGIAEQLFHWSGSGQTGPQNQPLPDSLVVRVVDYGFNPVTGVTVAWTVTSGNGNVSPTTSVTGAEGLAATQFTLGDTTFSFQSVIATSAAVPADTITFSASPSGAPSGVAGATVQPTRSVVEPPVMRRAPRLERPVHVVPAPPARPVRSAARNEDGERS